MSDIKDAARGHWPQILSALAGLSEKQLRNKHQPCPLCGGKDRYRYDDRFQNGDWFCNQCGGPNGHGGAGDGFSMLMRRNGWTFKEAAQRVEGRLGLSHRDLALSAAPPLENAEAYWRYSSNFYVVRYPGKRFRPLTFNGQKWERKAPLSPKPLLNVDRLQAHPHAPVLLVEGEKTADAAQQLFIDAVVSTWPCGCKAVGKADFSPLKGRRVMLWPDADEVGIAAMKKVAEVLRKVGAAEVITIIPPKDVPPGWDLADADWTPEQAQNYALENQLTESAALIANGSVLNPLKGFVHDLIAQKLSPHDRRAAIRTEAHSQGIRVHDDELQALEMEVQREIRGEGDGITCDDELDIPDDQWGWESILVRGGLNLWTALQKVGKTNLVLQMLSLWSAGSDSFLGQAFCGPCPPVIIVGVDMGIGSWRGPLMATGLMETTTAFKYKIRPPVVKLFTREQPLYLDEKGTEALALLCQEHEKPLILIDSYAKVTAPLGIDEFKPEAANPIYDLMSAVAPYEATVVLIHHSSKSRAGERASNAARGSNALTAAVDQLVNLKWHSDKDDDHRVELHTEGRGDKPIHLVIEQENRCQWMLHGNAQEINAKEAREKQKNQLNERQGKVLRAVNHAWEKEHREVYSRTLRQELEVEFSQVKDAEKAARDTLDQLADKGLLDKRKTTLEGKGDVVLFRPYGADLSKSDVSALWKYPPDTPHPPDPLKCVQPQKGFIHSHSFSGESAEGKGGPESVFTKPGSDALTLPIKDANTSCKPRLEDDPHWPPRPEKR
mgnify:FL=1